VVVRTGQTGLPPGADMPVKGGYLALAGGGALLIWSGLKGKSWSQVLRTILNGRKPETALTAYSIAGTPPGADTAVAASGANVGPLATAIASDAATSVGRFRYVFGGSPVNGTVDCSSFANEIIGNDQGAAIPMYAPGTYHGQSHGPPTTVWLVWSGCFTIQRQDMMPGDLAVWQTHMGIIVGKETMVSALNPQLGIMQTSIDGGAPAGEILRIRRLKAVTRG
jgi:cell wall-associated NlpC family hydrolase